MQTRHVDPERPSLWTGRLATLLAGVDVMEGAELLWTFSRQWPEIQPQLLSVVLHGRQLDAIPEGDVLLVAPLGGNEHPTAEQERAEVVRARSSGLVVHLLWGAAVDRVVFEHTIDSIVIDVRRPRERVVRVVVSKGHHLFDKTPADRQRSTGDGGRQLLWFRLWTGPHTLDHAPLPHHGLEDRWGRQGRAERLRAFGRASKR